MKKSLGVANLKNELKILKYNVRDIQDALDSMSNASSPGRPNASSSSRKLRKTKSGLNKQQTCGTQSKAASRGPDVTGDLRHTNSNSDPVLN